VKTRAVPVPGNALVSFDISWFDGALKRYYLGDRSNKSVDVIDPPSTVTQFKPGFVGARTIDDDGNVGCIINPITDPSCASSNDISGPDGVLTLPNAAGHKELWVGDGESRVWVLDAGSGAVLPLPLNVPNPIPTSTNNHRRADELCYDSRDHLVMVANNADSPPFGSIISTQSYTVVGKISFDGTNGAPKSTNGAEQCQWSPRTGMFYISIPGVNKPDDGTGAVAVIDPQLKKVVKVFPIPLADCAAPQGMALGPDRQILLGCNAPSPNGHSNTVIINENTGAVIGRLPDLGGNDEVWYNPGDGHYSLAGGQNVPTEQLGIVDSAGHRADVIVDTADNPNATSRRAHSVAADPNLLHEVYVPIPATGAAAPGYSSDLCADPTKGCIAVFGAVGRSEHPRGVQERGADDNQN
jgi:hypothetical protein